MPTRITTNKDTFYAVFNTNILICFTDNYCCYAFTIRIVVWHSMAIDTHMINMYIESGVDLSFKTYLTLCLQGWKWFRFINPEAATGGVLWKKMFLNLS